MLGRRVAAAALGVPRVCGVWASGASPVMFARRAHEEASARAEEGGRVAGRSDMGRTVRALLALSKARLTGLVVVSAAFGHLMYGPPGDFLSLGALVVGTSLASASANTWNQLFEVEYDAAMLRTRGRPLPAGRVTRAQAATFGLAAGVVGVGTLYAGCGAVAAGLGLANIGLYALVYTPLKRVTPLNTEVGSVVGAIPPLMGWAAAGGALSDPGAAALFGLLFLWQMPHFYALAWRHREDYARAGYRMVSLGDATGAQTANRTLFYTAALAALPFAVGASGATGPMFAIETSVLNLYLLWLAWKFRRNTSDDSARKLFLTTLWYLPVLMLMMSFHSRGWRLDAQTAADELFARIDDPADQSLEARFRRQVLTTRAWLRGNACPHEVVVHGRRSQPHSADSDLQWQQQIAETCAVQRTKRRQQNHDLIDIPQPPSHNPQA
jgi:heme o synthase